MASGLVCRANRPNTWLHRPAGKREEKALPTRSRPHMKRRKFIMLLGGAAAAWPLALSAQQQTKTAAPARVGLLTVSAPTAPMLNAFREGMREHGYVEGQNLSIDVRWPRGSTDEISALALDLANANLDVIVAWATPSVLALQRATSTVPIVMVSVGDPLGSGFVASLARPGANITGLSNITADLSGKLLELFSELVPNLKHVGIVSNSYNPNVAVQLRQTEEAARSLGLRSRIVDTSAAEDFERAFARLSAEGVDGVVLLADPLVLGGRLNEREQIRDSGGLPRRSDCFEAFSNSSTTTALIIVSCFDDENDGSKLLD
jgi:putative ABC transport system substrate-binding protein